MLGVSGLHRLYLSLPQIELLMIQYRDPCDPTRVCWKTFEDDIDQVFTIKVGIVYSVREFVFTLLTNV